MTESAPRPGWKIKPRLRANARALRHAMTPAERRLWFELRDHRLNGAGFRRQAPIGRYVADFLCHAAALVVELDGGQHFDGPHELKDATRTAALNRLGFRVLRFSNNDVMTNRAGVLEVIAVAIAEHARQNIDD